MIVTQKLKDKILTYLIGKGEVALSMISSGIGAHYSYVKLAVDELVKEGLLKERVFRNWSYYELKEK